MRKILAIIAFVLFPILAEAQTFDFDKNGDIKSWRYGGGTVEVADGLYTFNIDGTNKNPNIRRSKIDTENAQYLHIVMKNNTNKAARILITFYDDNDQKVFVKKNISNNDKEFVTYSFYLGSQKGWTGKKNINLRFTNNVDKIKGVIVIDKIALNNNISL